MTDVFLAVFLALGLLYCSLVFAFVFGIYRINDGYASNTPAVTVVVPAHNEADQLPACLTSLAAQTYSPEHTEIIVVNDRSTDQTLQIAQSWSNQLPGLQILSVEQSLHACPKKNALAQGIRAGTGTLILVTDADCRPPPDWISATVRCFEPEVGMVLGFAPLTWDGGFLNGLLALQSLVVNGLAAGSAGVGFPLTCSGRNLAYRRTAFEEVGGFNAIGHILGGDDVLLMHEIAHQTAWRIRFNPDKSAAVPSNPHADRQFQRQVRYQSKAIHGTTLVLILAFAIYIFHLLLGFGPLFFGSNPSLWLAWGSIWTAKILADGLLLGYTALRFESPTALCWFPILECLLIPYIVVFCALGVLKPSRWR